MPFTPGLENSNTRRDWWSSLSTHWKHVFQQVVFNKSGGNPEITDDELAQLCSTNVLRIVGPGGPNPSYHGSLINLEGLRRLTQLEYLFVMNCQLESLDGIEDHILLKSLFVQNNNLTSIAQIRKMASLEELYISNNQISSIHPLKNCKMLHTVFCEQNTLTSLDGIRPYHEKTLKLFKCKPNDNLPQRELIRIQNTFGILCH
jgi:Leucine-rich repeat (LRR) protein